MAGYDSKTDTIFGCKEKSKMWWHEKGHQELAQKESWKELEMFNQYILLMVLAFLTANLRLVAALFLLTYIIIYSFDEWYATIYMYKHKSEWIK